jgi:hypothetical protein
MPSAAPGAPRKALPALAIEQAHAHLDHGVAAGVACVYLPCDPVARQ